MTSAWVRRWVISVSLTGVLALALLWRGDTMFGVLVGALALTRAVLFTRLHLRRDRSRRLRAPQTMSRLTEPSGS
jgi:hypothetical protein